MAVEMQYGVLNRFSSPFLACCKIEGKAVVGVERLSRQGPVPRGQPPVGLPAGNSDQEGGLGPPAAEERRLDDYFGSSVSGVLTV
jgi:hypothetical protein